MRYVNHGGGRRKSWRKKEDVRCLELMRPLNWKLVYIKPWYVVELRDTGRQLGRGSSEMAAIRQAADRVKTFGLERIRSGEW